MSKYINQTTYTDYPESASNNAKRALDWRDENNNPNGCGTRVGWARANQLANKEPISAQTVKRMASFNRHRQNKDVPYSEGCGGLMWDAWGGTSGIDWAINKSKEIDNMVKINLTGEVVDFDFSHWYNKEYQQFFTDKEVENMLAELVEDDEVEFNVSSPGGDVIAGMRIAAMIEEMPQKTTAVLTGVVASIATPISLAADKVLARKSSMMMIHNASTMSYGDKNQMRKDANTLEQIDEQLLDLYIDRVKKNGKLMDGDEAKTRKAFKKMMDEETWIPAKKAVELGLVDAMCDDDKEKEEKPEMFAMNSNNKKILASFSNLPNEIRAQVQPRKKGIFASILNFFAPKEEPKEEKQEPTNNNSKNQDDMDKELLARLEALENKMTASAEQNEAKLKEQAEAHKAELEAIKAENQKAIEAAAKEKEELEAKLKEANIKAETSAPNFPKNSNDKCDKFILSGDEKEAFAALGAAIKAKL